jgi:hypothetical protein
VNAAARSPGWPAVDGCASATTATPSDSSRSPCWPAPGWATTGGPAPPGRTRAHPERASGDEGGRAGRRAGRVTRIVARLLQTLGEDGRSGLAEPPLRHALPPSFAALQQEIAHAFPASAHVASRRCPKPCTRTCCRSWTAGSCGLKPRQPALRCASCGRWSSTAGSPRRSPGRACWRSPTTAPTAVLCAGHRGRRLAGGVAGSAVGSRLAKGHGQAVQLGRAGVGLSHPPAPGRTRGRPGSHRPAGISRHRLRLPRLVTRTTSEVPECPLNRFGMRSTDLDSFRGGQPSDQYVFCPGASCRMCARPNAVGERFPSRSLPAQIRNGWRLAQARPSRLFHS